MSVNLSEKKTVVDEINGVSQEAPCFIAMQYRGMTSNDLNNFRKEARESGVLSKVVKNTLARRALKGTPFEACSDALDGPNILLFSLNEPNSAAKLAVKYLNDNKAAKLQVLSLSGSGKLDHKQLKSVANMPNREQALSMLLSCLQGPVRQVATSLSDVAGRLARVVQAVSEQKQSAS
ncbi:MAG TPA: 50S ribosomal protein L10 [Gammaproteobacteria bacterium]|nr:50S ribosomal protein L10 [Gammaproteobacteria bacterium]